MKSIILIIVLAILIAPYANAVTTSELKVVLKEVLKTYFQNPSSSKLNKPELRDLLISFFQTPTGKDADLNKLGKYSGEFLQDIYDKTRQNEWTIMVFMNGDNNLEAFGIANINDMEQTGSSKDVNVIVQFDRSPEFDTSNGNWNTTKIFYITKDNDSEKINSKELADLGEVDMGSPKFLEDFIFYNMENYPAKHYALILWNHGGGWVGLSNDDTDNPAGLSVQALADALKDITNKKHKKLDIVGFDACLMGMLEVYSQISEFADIGIGSEELEPGKGWNYADLLKYLNENPKSDARTFASQITKSYHDYYEDKDSTITLSAINLSKMDDIINSLSNIATKINLNINLTWREIARANNQADRYNSPTGHSNIDLFDLLDLLIPASSGTEIHDDLINAQRSVASAVIDNVKGTAHNFASGLSIYFPRASEDYDASYNMENTKFAEETGWDDMIQKFYVARKELDKEPPNITIDSYDVQPEAIYFNVNLSGDDISTVSFIVAVEDGNISVDWLEESFNLDFSQFEEGQIPFYWDYTVPFLFNGENFSFASIKPTDRTGTKFFVEGLYQISSTNETFNATLFFDSGILISAYINIPYGDELIPSPIEIMPEDIFIPYLSASNFQTPEFFKSEADPININEGLSIQYLIPEDADRTYILLFSTGDLSDNFAASAIIYQK